MTLQIRWQSNVNGPKVQLIVPFLDVELAVTLIQDVIIDATWQIPSTPAREHNQTEMLKKLQDYLLNPYSSHLDVQLLQQGTEYSHKVWNALIDIPFGQVLSYSALAIQLASGPRAVANACRNNPYPGIIPCHRVVSKAGIGGFMGQSEGDYVELKRRLLAYERHLAASLT
jgi:methylated-DNA-[protein]-cysteine S-methyltransferase